MTDPAFGLCALTVYADTAVVAASGPREHTPAEVAAVRTAAAAWLRDHDFAQQAARPVVWLRTGWPMFAEGGGEIAVLNGPAGDVRLLVFRVPTVPCHLLTA